MSLLSLFQKKSSAAEIDDGDFQSRSAEDSADLRNSGSAGSRGKRKSSRQTTEPIDPMLPEKKRARRRLVGAVALVLAAVIGLPMVLDSEQKPLGDDVAIQIPSKDQSASGNSKGGAAAGTAKNAATTMPKITDKNASKNSAANSDVRLAPSIALSPSEEVVNIPAPAASNDAAGTAKAATGSADKASPSATPGNATTSPQKLRLESAPLPKPSKAPPSKEASNTGDPAPAKTDTARAQSILNGGDSTGKDNAANKSEPKKSKVIVQVAALASKEKVSELQDKLKAAGIASFTQTVATESGPRIRIRIGPFNSKDEADNMRAKLTKIGLSGTLVPS